MNLTCADPLHASNNTQPGWNDGVLGTADKPARVICPGCTIYRSSLPDITGTNQTTLQQRLDQSVALMGQWIANNPNGAQLTAPQTLAAVKMWRQMAMLIRGALNDITGT